jgi:hypothetical protein
MPAASGRVVVALLAVALAGIASAGDSKAAAPATSAAGTSAETVVTLSPQDQAVFDGQISTARSAAAQLATPADATAAGYTQASTQLPGIGTHWINWTLLDKPFDAAHPAMLLFDQSPLRASRLAGLSYWIRSTSAPVGFAGPNDHWHQHSGLCFEDGWLRHENVSADQCPGQWFSGADLWMLHVWVAPGFANTDGVFAARNTKLCPAYFEQVPDVLRCDSPANAALPGSHGDPSATLPDDNAYSHLPLQ